MPMETTLSGEAYAKSTAPSIDKKITGSTTADGKKRYNRYKP